MHEECQQYETRGHGRKPMLQRMLQRYRQSPGFVGHCRGHVKMEQIHLKMVLSYDWLLDSNFEQTRLFRVVCFALGLMQDVLLTTLCFRREIQGVILDSVMRHLFVFRPFGWWARMELASRNICFLRRVMPFCIPDLVATGVGNVYLPVAWNSQWSCFSASDLRKGKRNSQAVTAVFWLSFDFSIKSCKNILYLYVP